MSAGRTPQPNGIIERPVSLRRRGDLTIVPVWYRDERWYVAKDPLALKYTRLRADEYRILQCLDGHATLRSLQQIYQREFTPRRVSVAKLQSLLGRFQELNLLTSSVSDHGATLLRASERERRRRWWSTATNLLFIKLPGVDPERFIRWLDRWLGWLFAPWIITILLMAAVVTAVWSLVHVQEFSARLPELDSLVSPSSIAAWVAVVGCIKICHELGHALSCKHFGGECHQIGPMLMIFTPVLYCDTSDAWLLPHRWQRIMVGAAGVYVELVIATLAAWVWWSTEPSLVNDVALRVLVVCTLGTLLVNANPFLRYDGYFVLADAWGVPNLADSAQSLWREDARRWFFGNPERSAHSQSLHGLLLRLYAALAWAYRVFLTLGISLVLYQWLAPRGLGAIFALMGTSLMASFFFPLARNVASTVTSPGARSQWRRLPTAFVSLLTIVIVSAFSFLPIPTGVIATGVIERDSQADVYAVVGGTLASIDAEPGDHVEQGELLVTLASPETVLAHEQALARRELKAMEVRELEIRQGNDPKAAEQLPAAREMLVDLDNQLHKANDDLSALRIVAPSPGIVVSPLLRAPSVSTTQLPTWSDSPLDSANLDAQLTAGTKICSVGSPDRWIAKLIVSESDRPWIQVGQPVRIVKSGWSESSLSGQVISSAVRSIDELPERMIRQAVVAVDPHDPNGLAPLVPSYLVTVALQPTSAPLHSGAVVHARIEVDRRSLGIRLWEWLVRSVRMI